jgi:hypothetical protein
MTHASCKAPFGDGLMKFVHWECRDLGALNLLGKAIFRAMKRTRPALQYQGAIGARSHRE